MTSWFVLFSIIFCLNSNFLFCNFLSIPSDTKIKWSSGANSRENNKFLNLDYLAGPNTWIINVQYVADFSQYDAHFLTPIELWNFPSDTKIIKKTSPYLELFWSAFSLIRTEYGEILRISPYSVRILENVDPNNSEYGRFFK